MSISTQYPRSSPPPSFRAETACSCDCPLLAPKALAGLAPYAFEPLTSASCFRVFVLAPGSNGEPIHGCLKEVDLTEENHSYNALSYTWIRSEEGSSMPQRQVDGSPSITPSNLNAQFLGEEQPKPHHVILDIDRMLAVTCSLYSALLRIRSLTEVVRLFVDALSIDQGTSNKSFQERAQQIRLMGSIFRNAQLVFADLSDHNDGAVDCLEELKRFANIDNVLWDDVKVDRQRYDALLPTGTASTEKFWRCFIALCSRAWWRRLWTLQETILAREVFF